MRIKAKHNNWYTTIATGGWQISGGWHISWGWHISGGLTHQWGWHGGGLLIYLMAGGGGTCEGGGESTGVAIPFPTFFKAAKYRDETSGKGVLILN